jgi:trigger factor
VAPCRGGSIPPFRIRGPSSRTISLTFFPEQVPKGMSIDGSRLNVTVQEEERWRRRMRVTVPAALVREEEQKAARKLASRVKMKGFRQGRIPSKVIETRFGSALRQEALDKLIGEAYRQALAVENLRPISEGQVEEVSYEPEQDLIFAIAFDVQPQIELARLGGFVVERPGTAVSDEHVDEVLAQVRRQNGAWQPAGSGTPVDGDLVNVRIRRLDGEAPSQEGKEYEFTLGQGDAIPGVESAIKTLEPGASGEFSVTFPADFPDEGRRGQEERIDLTLLGRKTLELPPLDDALARAAGSFETLDELRARIHDDLERDAREQAEAVVRGRILDSLIEANPFDVPRSMADRYADAVLGEQKDLPPERLQEIRDTIRPEAERAVKRLLIVDQVARIRQLNATEAELDERIDSIAKQNDTAPAQVYASLQKAGRLEALEREITEAKVFDFLKSQSEITETAAR